ncbi:hypothetical protein K488DRAFT_73911 [Vararia minispora EC-137]|uniref:Uncharacterized protein n=1 Tax=Vararia minispora EC-137 TaxID=1314806 RepID=A0ACB8Q977_9AGAM|nr:hypothetical protein K488DRAFT_73911 [Vararia minispora EC-137]
MRATWAKVINAWEWDEVGGRSREREPDRLVGAYGNATEGGEESSQCIARLSKIGMGCAGGSRLEEAREWSSGGGGRKTAEGRDACCRAEPWPRKKRRMEDVEGTKGAKRREERKDGQHHDAHPLRPGKQDFSTPAPPFSQSPTSCSYSETSMASSAADTTSQSDVADVIVFDAKGLPTRCVENLRLSMPRRFLVSITSGETTKRTTAVPHSEGVAEWKQVLAGFTVPRSADLKFSILVQRNNDEKSVGENGYNVEMFWAQDNQHYLPTGNLKVQDAVPLLASGQQAASPASATPYEPGSTDNRPAQNPAQLSTSGLPVIETVPEENTINVSSTVDVSNTDPPPLASAIVDGANLVNTINTQVDSWTTLLDNVNVVAQILDKISQIHPYASLACGVLSVIPKASRSPSSTPVLAIPYRGYRP